MRLNWIICFLLTLILSHSQSYAAGNVLLPQSSGDTNSLPSLGLGVTAPAVPAPATSEGPAGIESAPLPAADPKAPDTAALESAITAASAPSPAAAPVVSPSVSLPPLSEPSITPVNAASAAGLPLGTIPTQVIRTPDSSVMLAQLNRNLPYQLTLAISSRSLFGAKDVQAVTGKLGLTREQIPSSCILSLGGLVRTDKDSYIVAGGAAQQVTVRYDGQIKDYLLSAEAFCTAGQLPPGSGFIEQVNNRYTVALQPIDCPAPTRQSTQVIIDYDGSGKSVCSYQ